MGGCTRGYGNGFLKLSVVCMVTKLKVLELFLGFFRTCARSQGSAVRKSCFWQACDEATAHGQGPGGRWQNSRNFAQLHLVHPQSQLVETERPPGTEHPPRDDLAAHEVQHFNHLVPRSSSRVELFSNCHRGYQLHPSRPGWPGAAWIACADKAHKVDGDGGARACSFTPHAAGTSTLVALRPPTGV